MAKAAWIFSYKLKNNISEDRIDESVRRILKFKFLYLDEDNVLDESFLGSIDHNDVVDLFN